MLDREIEVASPHEIMQIEAEHPYYTFLRAQGHTFGKGENGNVIRLQDRDDTQVPVEIIDAGIAREEAADLAEATEAKVIPLPQEEADLFDGTSYREAGFMKFRTAIGTLIVGVAAASAAALFVRNGGTATAEPRITVSASPSPSPTPTPELCEGRWEIKEVEHDFDLARWFKGGVKEIKEAKNSTDAAIARDVWVDKIKYDPELLAGASTHWLKREILADKLRGDDGCISAYGEQIAIELGLTLQEYTVETGLVPDNMINTGINEKGQVTQAEKTGIGGDRKGLIFKDEHGHIVGCILGRCGQIVIPEKNPHLLPGPVDQEGSETRRERDGTADDGPDGYDIDDQSEDPKDTDKDGIYDLKDQCDTKPETKNGYKDNDGCPDKLPPAEDGSDPVTNPTPKPTETAPPANDGGGDPGGGGDTDEPD